MTIVADSNGVLRGKFNIPANVPSGSKSVAVIGLSGQSGRAVFSGQGTLEHQVWQQQTDTTTVRWQSPPPPPPVDWGGRGVDPLAQTFTLAETTQVPSVDLFFAVRPTTPVNVQIRGTANGVPNQDVLATKTLNPSDVVLGGAETRFPFLTPVTLLGGVEYAVVILCGDAVGELFVAEIGKFDTYAQRWVTQQPYNVGVLLSSSNASTWTPHQDRDLTVRMTAAEYLTATRTFNLGAIAVTDATDLLLLSYAERPDGQSDVSYSLALPNGSTITVGDGQPIQLPAAITGNIGITALLKGTSKLSPILYPGTQMVVGKIGQTADYVTRAIPGGSSVTVKVVYEAFVPSGATITVQYKGPDVGDTWTTIGSPTTRPVDDGFVEFTHSVSGVNELSVQIKLILTGNTAARPRVRDLRTFVL